MPEHVHLLIGEPQRGTLAILIQVLKQRVSRGMRDTEKGGPNGQLSQTLVGKRITIRGKLFMFKCGPGIQFDDGGVVCLVDIPRKSILDDPYTEMYEKPVEATGTLGFYHDSTPLDETRSTQRQHDHYYFEKKTTQVRLITNYVDNTTASAARSQLSALV